MEHNIQIIEGFEITLFKDLKYCFNWAKDEVLNINSYNL